MSRLRLLLIPSILALLAACSFQLTFNPNPNSSVVSSQKYRLTIVFQDDVALTTETQIGQTFSQSINHGTDESYAIGGMLLPLEGQSIPMILTISQNKFQTGQVAVVAGTSKCNIIPNQPLVVTSSPGYTITLIPVN